MFYLKIKTGIDIIEVERIKNMAEKSNGRFLNKIYTENEIQYCNSKKNKYEHFAARFAAKEACFKAISDVLDSKYNIDWKDIEILNDKNGKPFISLHKQLNLDIDIDISLSHIEKYGCASVVTIIYEKGEE